MNSSSKIVSTSKFLSLVLRHEPQLIGLTLGDGGWVSVSELLTKCALAKKNITLELLREVVETNDKKRFAFSEDGLLIRANQGHSVEINLGLEPIAPPEHLYHGTASRFLDAIQSQGLNKQARHHVHLTESRDVAVSVGQRHGAPVILEVAARVMHQAGHRFYRSDNGVWLVERVDVQYIRRLEQIYRDDS